MNERVRAFIKGVDLKNSARGACDPEPADFNLNGVFVNVEPGPKCLGCVFNRKCTKSTVLNSGGGNVIGGFIDKDPA